MTDTVYIVVNITRANKRFVIDSIFNNLESAQKHCDDWNSILEHDAPYEFSIMEYKVNH